MRVYKLFGKEEEGGKKQFFKTATTKGHPETAASAEKESSILISMFSCLLRVGHGVQMALGSNFKRFGDDLVSWVKTM